MNRLKEWWQNERQKREVDLEDNIRVTKVQEKRVEHNRVERQSIISARNLQNSRNE